MSTTSLARRRGGRGLYPRPSVQQKAEQKRSLPEYLEPAEVEALIQAAPHGQARLLFLIQWRAGLRISEAMNLSRPDLQQGDSPSLRVRRGKGGKDRLVPLHLELAAAFQNAMDYGLVGSIFFPQARATGWRWLKLALAKAELLGKIAPGRRVGTHTLRHSAARHWLESGVPINHVSRWLGHSSIQTTLVYLEILPDPVGYMERVP